MKLPAQPPIYLDHHATTPVDPRVAAVIMDAMTSSFGNANSVEHLYGEIAADMVTEARRDVAELVGAEPEGVHFTSGSTESIWLAISHAVASCKGRPLRVALSTVEHQAVLECATSALASSPTAMGRPATSALSARSSRPLPPLSAVSFLTIRLCLIRMTC